MKDFSGKQQMDQAMHSISVGDKDGQPILWGHGWGQSHQAFMPLVSSLEGMGFHHIIDFPGFGDSPVPDQIWGTAGYADFIAQWIMAQNMGPILWCGHSFGGRVGLQLAARHPELVRGLFLMAAAGLPRKRSFLQKLNHKMRVYSFKALKKLKPLGVGEDWLRQKFGSADYLNAGEMRDIMVKVVNEDLSDVAAKITCPVMLVYGEKDSETPPEIGYRLEKLIGNAEMVLLPAQDHYSVLGEGRHQVASQFKNFVKRIT